MPSSAWFGAVWRRNGSTLAPRCACMRKVSDVIMDASCIGSRSYPGGLRQNRLRLGRSVPRLRLAVRRTGSDSVASYLFPMSSAA
jgi:hypothetical protein